MEVTLHQLPQHRGDFHRLRVAEAVKVERALRPQEDSPKLLPTWVHQSQQRFCS